MIAWDNADKKIRNVSVSARDELSKRSDIRILPVGFRFCTLESNG